MQTPGSSCFANHMEGTSRNDDVKREESRCFVCDDKVQGRYYALATCKTQSSRSRVIEKLGELVGERYMVVISEDDVICRSCANLVNTLDRLESEMRNVRDHVLQFLEQKYSLKKGELLESSDRPKSCQPPQITRCNAKDTISYRTRQSEIDLETYSREKKRQKSHSWLQCNRCKYTTHLNSFVMYHMRDHEKRKIFCDKCGMCISESQEMTRHGCGTYKSENKENEKDNFDVVINDDSLKTTSLLQSTTLQTAVPSVQATPPPLVGLSSCDHLYISSVLLSAEDSPHTSCKQPVYVLQQANAGNVDSSGERTRALDSCETKGI